MMATVLTTFQLCVPAQGRATVLWFGCGEPSPVTSGQLWGVVPRAQMPFVLLKVARARHTQPQNRITFLKMCVIQNGLSIWGPQGTSGVY